MMPVQDGMNVDQNILIQTQKNFIAQDRLKEVQMEAAIQQLLTENQRLYEQLEKYENPIIEVESGQE